MKAEVCGAFKVLKGKSNLHRDPSFRVQVGGFNLNMFDQSVFGINKISDHGC